MQTDIVNLCLTAIVVIAGFALASRTMGRGRGYPGSRTSRPGTGLPDILVGTDRPTSSGGYPGRRGGRLFPPRGTSSTTRSTESRPQSGGSAFPPGDGSGQSGLSGNRPDNGYGGRRGGSLFPPKDSK